MTKIVGLIGKPLAHSLSPAMHNAAFQALGLDYEYQLFPMEPKDIPTMIQKIRDDEIVGINVTVPYKENVISYLDGLSEMASQIKAVNTVIKSDGKIIGYNTDAPGFLTDLKSQNYDPKDKVAVIMGAGGGAKAIATALCHAKVAGLTITDKIEEKAIGLKESLKAFFDIPIETLSLKNEAFKIKVEESNLLVNATPIGMHPHENASPLPDEIKIPKTSFVYDLIYNPPQTTLLKRAVDSGAQISNGLGMLLYQGALAFEKFTDNKPDTSLMLTTLLENL